MTLFFLHKFLTLPSELLPLVFNHVMLFSIKKKFNSASSLNKLFKRTVYMYLWLFNSHLLLTVLVSLLFWNNSSTLPITCKCHIQQTCCLQFSIVLTLNIISCLGGHASLLVFLFHNWPFSINFLCWFVFYYTCKYWHSSRFRAGLLSYSLFLP